ncbi:MAG: efflux RND transporter periplasmic adaptor subunit [Myxococcales bacterium]|nr:efflux RND transporter periplasmic adaptor subunit [Myxococcales bacterium]
MSGSGRKSGWWKLFFALVAVGLLGLSLWLLRARGQSGEKIDPSLVAKVSRGDLEVAVVELGKIEPREKVAVRSKVAGQVDKIFIEEGMAVKQGQLLLSLDPTEFQRSVVRARQDVDKAAAAVELAQLMLDRRKQALADRAVAQVEVETAQNDLKTRKILLDQAKESLSVAEDQLRYSRIISPLDGTVIQRNIRIGETVVPGTMATFDERSLMVVADMSTLIAKADLNQIDVAKVKLDQAVTLTLDALPGKTFKARVTKIAPASVLPKGKDVEVFPVEATLEPGALSEIRPGMTADIKIHVETKKNVLKLPIEAVIKEKGQTYVNCIAAGESNSGASVTSGLGAGMGKKGPNTKRVDVQVGARNDREQEILSGVKENDEVLIRPPSAEANEFK